MVFTIQNHAKANPDYLRQKTLLEAYYCIKHYPLGPAELLLDTFIQQQYNISLKNLCIRLLLKVKFYQDKSGNLLAIFKDPRSEQLGRLITYGNGVIAGSQILKTALTN